MKLKKILGLGVLALGCLTLGVCTSQFFKDGFNKVKDKIDDIITPTTTTDVESDETVIVDGEEVKTGSIVDMPSTLMFKRASADSEGITIKANVVPSYATNTKLIWSLRWEDESNTSDVSTFVSITPSVDSLSCNIKALNLFTKNIILSVSTVDDSIVKNINVSFIPLLEDYTLYFTRKNCDDDDGFSGNDFLFNFENVGFYDNDPSSINEFRMNVVDDVFYLDFDNYFELWNYNNNLVNSSFSDNQIYAGSFHLDEICSHTDFNKYSLCFGDSESNEAFVWQSSDYDSGFLSLSDTALNALANHEIHDFTEKYKGSQLLSQLHFDCNNPLRFLFDDPSEEDLKYILEILKEVQDSGEDIFSFDVYYHITDNSNIEANELIDFSKVLYSGNIHYTFGAKSIDTSCPVIDIVLDTDNVVLQ